MPSIHNHKDPEESEEQRLKIFEELRGQTLKARQILDESTKVVDVGASEVVDW